MTLFRNILFLEWTAVHALLWLTTRAINACLGDIVIKKRSGNLVASLEHVVRAAHLTRLSYLLMRCQLLLSASCWHASDVDPWR